MYVILHIPFKTVVFPIVTSLTLNTTVTLLSGMLFDCVIFALKTTFEEGAAEYEPILIVTLSFTNFNVVFAL